MPSVPGNLSASHLSLRVGTFARQSSAFGAPTYRGQFGSRNFPEVPLSKDIAEASPDVSNASCSSLRSLPELGSPSILPVLYLTSFHSMDLKDLGVLAPSPSQGDFWGVFAPSGLVHSNSLFLTEFLKDVFSLAKASQPSLLLFCFGSYCID